MLRLDGGLTGFIAPAGTNTYELRYTTPYFVLGVGLASGGIVLFAAYTGLRIFLKKKKERSEEEKQS